MPRVIDSILFALRFSSRSFTDQAVNVMLAARKHALKRRLHDITPDHVLFGVMALPRRCVGQVALRNRGLDLESAREEIRFAARSDSHPLDESNTPPRVAPETKQLVVRAQEQAHGLGVNYVGTEHLVLALLAGKGAAADFLCERGITAERFLAEIQKLYAGLHKSPSSDRRAG
ncbi:MAG TPA: Clp protease N-terminal domain-containing protein [Isosphaeraceae bacterium]|nr:Clp protease N-terminal domain-containing protein [Isosphaeraceae bacterium]